MWESSFACLHSEKHKCVNVRRRSILLCYCAEFHDVKALEIFAEVCFRYCEGSTYWIFSYRVLIARWAVKGPAVTIVVKAALAKSKLWSGGLLQDYHALHMSSVCNSQQLGQLSASDPMSSSYHFHCGRCAFLSLPVLTRLGLRWSKQTWQASSFNYPNIPKSLLPAMRDISGFH